MICCLLALLAALPGIPLLRWMRGNRMPASRCASVCVVERRRDVGTAVAVAGVITAVTGTALSIHKLGHPMHWQEPAPICSALDRLSTVNLRDFRVTASNP